MILNIIKSHIRGKQLSVEVGSQNSGVCYMCHDFETFVVSRDTPVSPILHIQDEFTNVTIHKQDIEDIYVDASDTMHMEDGDTKIVLGVE